MSREISWEELSDRLAQLAGRVPLANGRTLGVIRSSFTLERSASGAESRALAFVEDERDSVEIKADERRIVIEVQRLTSFIAHRTDFMHATEAEIESGWVDVEIGLAPDLTLNIQFEHFETATPTDELPLRLEE